MRRAAERHGGGTERSRHLRPSRVPRHGLREADLGKLASWWHTDADLGRPMEVLADMGKSRKAGFTGYQSTPDAFDDLFARLEAERIIPPLSRAA